MLPFVKSQALGNDYLVLEAAHLDAPLTPAAVRRLCDRHFGVGADGVLLLVPATRASFGLRIFNPDGSEAEKSGNGLRIFAKYLYEHGHTRERRFTIETPGGMVEAELRVEGDRVPFVIVELGRATFRSAEIPVAGADREVVSEQLLIDDRALTVTCVSVGNPHCVTFVDQLNEAEVQRLGPLIERAPEFPNRINVQFARMRSRRALDIRIWERGAGYTLASGSSASAAACAAVRDGRADHGTLVVGSPGGELEVEVRPDWSVRLGGPAAEVCSGSVSAELVESLRRGDPIPGLPA